MAWRSLDTYFCVLGGAEEKWGCAVVNVGMASDRKGEERSACAAEGDGLLVDTRCVGKRPKALRCVLSYQYTNTYLRTSRRVSKD
jgi:hypothetical protein